jgi:hypothetical protein
MCQPITLECFQPDMRYLTKHLLLTAWLCDLFDSPHRSKIVQPYAALRQRLLEPGRVEADSLPARAHTKRLLPDDHLVWSEVTCLRVRRGRHRTSRTTRCPCKHDLRSGTAPHTPRGAANTCTVPATRAAPTAAVKRTALPTGLHTEAQSCTERCTADRGLHCEQSCLRRGLQGALRCGQSSLHRGAAPRAGQQGCERTAPSSAASSEGGRRHRGRHRSTVESSTSSSQFNGK